MRIPEDFLLMDIHSVYLDSKAFKVDVELSELHSKETTWDTFQGIPILFTHKGKPLDIGYFCSLVNDNEPVLIPLGRIYISDGEASIILWHQTNDSMAAKILSDRILSHLGLEHKETSVALLVEFLADNLIKDIETRITFLSSNYEVQLAIVHALLAGVSSNTELEAKILELEQRAIMPGVSDSEMESIKEYLHVLRAIPTRAIACKDTSLETLLQALDSTHHGSAKEKRFLASVVALFTRAGVFPKPICLVGPPGTGKSTLAASTAEALGIPTATIHLGGMRDTHMLTGFNRSYKKSKPGAIIKTLIDAQVSNPVLVLNEIDKSDEAIQNILLDLFDANTARKFTDYYLEIPVDVSKCLFICTANSLDKLIPALRNRLMIIQLPGLKNDEWETLVSDFTLAGFNKAFKTNYQLDAPALRSLAEIKQTRDIESTLIMMMALAGDQELLTQDLFRQARAANPPARSSVGFKIP